MAKLTKYGMRLRGFSPGAQPMNGFVKRHDDLSGKYYDVIEYDRELTEKETQTYSMEKIKNEGEQK